MSRRRRSSVAHTSWRSMACGAATIKGIARIDLRGGSGASLGARLSRGPAMDSEFNRIVDALPGLVWTMLPDGQIDFLSQRWTDFTGLAVDRSCGRGWQAAVHPEDLARLLAGWRTVSGARSPVETKARLRGTDGTYRWFLFRAHPKADPSGQIVNWCGLSIDIEDRKRTEEALRESAARFRDYAETASDWLWEMGPDYKFTWLTENAFGSDAAHRMVPARSAGIMLSTLKRNRRSGGLFLQLSIHAARFVTSCIAPWTLPALRCT